MGVMQCDRKGCENIMCDRGSSKYGYICWECYEELEHKKYDMTVAEFMTSPKQDSKYGDYEIDLDKIFPLNH